MAFTFWLLFMARGSYRLNRPQNRRNDQCVSFWAILVLLVLTH
jgi:hypothetical protein